MTRALTEAGSAHCTACPALMAQLAGPSKVWDCLTRASLTNTEGLSCFTASHKVLATPVSQPRAALPALKQDAPMMISGARYSSVPTKELVRATGSARKSKVRMSDCLLMGLPCTQKHPGLASERFTHTIQVFVAWQHARSQLQGGRLCNAGAQLCRASKGCWQAQPDMRPMYAGRHHTAAMSSRVTTYRCHMVQLSRLALGLTCDNVILISGGMKKEAAR